MRLVKEGRKCVIEGAWCPEKRLLVWDRKGNSVRGRQDPEAEAAPATVSGEPMPLVPLVHPDGEGGQRPRPASQETCQASETLDAVGCDGKENEYDDND